jgi:hypothetical protein
LISIKVSNVQTSVNERRAATKLWGVLVHRKDCANVLVSSAGSEASAGHRSMGGAEECKPKKVWRILHHSEVLSFEPFDAFTSIRATPDPLITFAKPCP